MYLTDQERAVGRENYYSAVTAHDQMTRRDFLVTAIAGGAGALGGLGALYFGYHQPARRVRVLRARDVAEPAMAEGEQMLRREHGAGLVVDRDARDAARLAPVDEQRRQAPGEVAEPRCLARRHADEQPVDPPVEIFQLPRL